MAFLSQAQPEIKSEIDYLAKLYTVVEHIDANTLAQLNKKKSFKYGWNKEYDFVCISKDGTVGSFYSIGGLIIGIPVAPKKVFKTSDKAKDQVWGLEEMPHIKLTKHFKNRVDFQRALTEATGEASHRYEEVVEFANEEFNRREEGAWFMNNGIPTYLTGSHYFYLRWANIDIGLPDYRDANRIFFYFWEACKADNRCFGMCYLKNRRSGFSFMSSSEIIHQATQSYDSQFGIMSKTGDDAKKMFTRKAVPISMRLPFFFKPIQSGEERPKSELEYAIPSTRLTKRKLKEGVVEDDFFEEGLDTTVSWRNTNNNSYDGDKLKLLILDEAGKIESKQGDIETSWRIHKTCLRLGSKVVGKCMMGSTCNALDKGGREFKNLFEQSDLSEVKRDGNGRTPSGLYALFIPMEFGYEGYIDKFGFPVFESPEEPVEGMDGEMIEIGVIDEHKNTVKGLKEYPDSLNEYHRQYPRTTSDAFRDEATNSLFNLTRIYDQIYHNNEFEQRALATQGSFRWKDGAEGNIVEFYPNNRGRFKVSWFPPKHMQNRVFEQDGYKIPGNKEFGCFGCDSYDISGTVGGGGSKGALHGLTMASMNGDVPDNEFFLEYVARPQTAEIFYEDVLMAVHFYGMEILIENNKPRLLYYFKDRGYRRFCMNRPDKRRHELSVTERELGGVPNTSEAMKILHSSAIESYIEENVGNIVRNGEEKIGRMPFNRTLEDWAGFDITKRTKFDASISSGLAIMATKRHLYTPQIGPTKKIIKMPFGRYSNNGMQSVRIKT